MTYCLSFAVRHRQLPLHFCFSTEREAKGALSEFADNVLHAIDDELVLVDGKAGFLKRSFVSVELEAFDTEDDDDGDEDGQGDEAKDPPGSGMENAIAQRGAKKRKGLEPELEEIVAAFR